MTNEESIDVLNKLIEINNDRIEGYEKASKETEDADLKILFSDLINTSEFCRAELTDHVIDLGGTPAEGTMVSGKFFRAWMDVKAALTGNDRKAILNSCEFGEDAAVSAYEKALELGKDESNIDTDLRNVIATQYSQIKSDHDKIKLLRDSLVEND